MYNKWRSLVAMNNSLAKQSRGREEGRQRTKSNPRSNNRKKLRKKVFKKTLSPRSQRRRKTASK